MSPKGKSGGAGKYNWAEPSLARSQGGKIFRLEEDGKEDLGIRRWLLSKHTANKEERIYEDHM